MAGLPISYVATLIQWRGAFVLIEVLLAVILALTVLTRNLEYKIVATRKKLEWDRFTHKYIFLLELKRHVYTSDFFCDCVIQCSVMWRNQTKIVHVNKLVATIMSLELGLRPTCASLIMIFINAQVGIGTSQYVTLNVLTRLNAHIICYGTLCQTDDIIVVATLFWTA